MDTSTAVSFLKESVGLFRDFTLESLQSLVEGSRIASFEGHECVMHQGDEATHFGVILGGEIQASIIGAGGARQPLGRLSAGDTFNEMALMTGDAVQADFIAESRCEALLIPISLFQSVIVAAPRAVQHMARTITDRIKSIWTDPRKAEAAFQPGTDPYGLKLKGERPEKILVINCGSSSLKYSFYDTSDDSRGASGVVERIGLGGTQLKHRGPGGERKSGLPLGGFSEAFQAMIAELTARETGVINGLGEVSMVAHRVVHGGDKFTEATLITDEVLALLEAYNSLAPLHNPVNIAGIREMRRILAAAPHIAVFDTAFHQGVTRDSGVVGLGISGVATSASGRVQDWASAG